MIIFSNYRLRLNNGCHVFVLIHPYIGLAVFRDKHHQREIPDWWEDLLIRKAVEWFEERGCKG